MPRRRKTKDHSNIKIAPDSYIAQNSIAMVGMMGVGKTTVGRRLAKKLGLPFYDSDDEIEKASGRTVAGYFRDHGEQAFRDGETKVIERLITGPPILLATGGGAYINDATREILSSNATTIWLKADFKTIMARVSRNKKRPLLNVEDPAGTLKKLIDERYPIYAEADITINANRGPHTRTVAAAQNALIDYQKQTQTQTVIQIGALENETKPI